MRFVQSSRAKVFSGADLASDSRTLLVNGASVTSTKTVPFDGGAVKASALVGRMVSIGGTVTRVTANTTSQLTVEDDVTASDNDVIYPAEGGKGGADVYSTLILGDDAYGVTEITGGGLQHIVKQLGSSGSADPPGSAGHLRLEGNQNGGNPGAPVHGAHRDHRNEVRRTGMSTQKKLPANEELVEYMAPLIGAATKKDVIVGVNGETIRIKRGVPVKIKRKFLKVLRQAAAQEYAAYQVMEQAQKGSAVALAKM